MSLSSIMLEQLSVARRIIEDGQEVVPAWRITTPDGTFLIFIASTLLSQSNASRQYL